MLLMKMILALCTFLLSHVIIPQGWKTNIRSSLSNKKRNSIQRAAYNGNIKKNINVVQWNLGPAHWINKVHTIEAMLMDFNPDSNPE